MQIEVIKKNVYGNDLLYIKDAKTARIVESLTHKKTVTENDLNNLQSIGAEVIRLY